MDDFKQFNTSVIQSSHGFLSLSEIIKSNGKSVADLLLFSSTRQSYQLTKLSSRSIREIDDYLEELKQELLCPLPNINVNHELSPNRDKDSFISTGLPTLDKQLGGNGIPLAAITEIFGSSGCGKSHLLLQLSLRSQLLSPDKNQCIYISTESFLETKRLNDMKNQYANDSQVSLDNISYVYCQDLESQDHILYTQLPIKLQQLQGKANVIIIDSIAQHLRREGSMDNCNDLWDRILKLCDQLKDIIDFQQIHPPRQKQLKRFTKSPKYRNKVLKTYYMYLLHRHLNRLAIKYNVAIVIVNQVSDFINTTIDADDDFLSDDILQPLNVNFQIGTTSGWDPNVIFQDQQKFVSRSKFQLPSSDFEETTFHLDKELNIILPPKKQQRVNGDDSDFDPRYARQQNQLNLDEDYVKQRDLLLRVHKLGNLTTKRVVPTLGYPWSARINIRIMLMKTYKPSIKDKQDWLEMTNNNSVIDPDTGMTYEQLMEGFNVNSNEEETSTTKKRSYSQYNSNSIAIESLIKGWQVERYAKVVHTKHNNLDHVVEKIQFEIRENGLFEV